VMGKKPRASTARRRSAAGAAGRNEAPDGRAAGPMADRDAAAGQSAAADPEADSAT